MKIRIKKDDIPDIIAWCSNSSLGPETNRIDNQWTNCEWIHGDYWNIFSYNLLDDAYIYMDARRIKQVQKTWFKLKWGWDKIK